jgi:hypothetical protein
VRGRPGGPEIDLVGEDHDAAEASRSFTPAEAEKIDLLFKELSTELNEQSSEDALHLKRDLLDLVLRDAGIRVRGRPGGPEIDLVGEGSTS